MTESLHRYTWQFLLLAGLLLFAGALFTVASPESPLPFVSSEYAIATESNEREAGGAVIPASCPSFEHNPGECDPPSFTATPNTINSGSSSTLAWSCVNSSSSSGVNFSTGGAPSGSADVSPTETTTFTVICENGGQDSETVTVLQPDLTITATPSRVRSGSATVISWSASSIEEGSCQVNGPSGVFATGDSGSQSTGSLTQESIYTLVCTTEAGQTSESVTVTILPIFEEF